MITDCPTCTALKQAKAAHKTLCAIGLHPGYYSDLVSAAEAVARMVQTLRTDLHDPPPDVQGRVLRLHGLYRLTLEDIRHVADAVCLLDGLRQGDPAMGTVVERAHRILQGALGADMGMVYAEDDEPEQQPEWHPV